MSRRPGRVVLFTVALMAGLSGGAWAQELYLTATVVTADRPLTVGSICVALDGSKSDRLSGLLSSPLPALAEHPSLIPSRILQEKLAHLAGTGLVIVGGPLLYLPGSVTSEAERSFYTALLQNIERSLPKRSLRVAVWATGGATPDLQSDHGTISFEFPSGSDSLQALVSNRFVRYRRGLDASYRYLPVRIRVDELVPVAKKGVAFGKTVSGDDVTFRSEDISALRGQVARLEGGPYRAETDIAKGNIIYSDMVGKILAIKAGKRIAIAFRKGNVEVTVPGSAYQSGAVGDLISVGPITTGARFRGRILSPTEVLVED